MAAQDFGTPQKTQGRRGWGSVGQHAHVPPQALRRRITEDLRRQLRAFPWRAPRQTEVRAIFFAGRLVSSTVPPGGLQEGLCRRTRCRSTGAFSFFCSAKVGLETWIDLIERAASGPCRTLPEASAQSRVRAASRNLATILAAAGRSLNQIVGLYQRQGRTSRRWPCCRIRAAIPRTNPTSL